MNQRIKNMTENRIEALICKVIFVCVVISVLTAVCAKVVIGEEKNRFTKEQYEMMEQDSVQEIRKAMNAHYLSNSGVMLTKMTEPEKNCIYEIQVHHKGLSHLNGEAMAELQEAMAECLLEIWGIDGKSIIENQPVFQETDNAVSIRYEIILNKE